MTRCAGLGLGLILAPASGGAAVVCLRGSSGSVRCFCPVPDCGQGDVSRATGWTSHTAMRPHLNDHCAGTLRGAVPPEYLAAHHLDACSVCGLLVDRRFNGAHPRCRPTQRGCVRRTSHDGADPSLPSLDEITSTFVPTLRHVPHAARASWAQCLARAVSSAASLNTVAAWQQLLMLPKPVLGTPSRGGRRHRTQAAQATKRRCQRWLDGERGELWSSTVPAALPRLVSLLLRLVCCLLAAKGELSRACAALVEPTPLPPSAETFTQLQDKHPRAALPDPALLGPPRPAAVPEFEAQAAARAVRGFKRASAPGPTGLRPDHLREALQTAHADEVAAHLALLSHTLARDEAPSPVAPFLAGASLHALPKTAGGVRPIAVGEVLRRLVGKLLCEAVREEARECLWPLQVGVGVKAGGEAAVHTTRQWAWRHASSPDRALVKVSTPSAGLPSLPRPGNMCLPLRVGLTTATARPPTSASGTAFCLPLSPLLFALALQPALLCFSYLDDVVIAGPAHHVARAMRDLVAEARRAGLLLEPSKCQLILSPDAAPNVDMLLFPSGLPVVATRCFELLGAPIGPDAFCQHYSSQTVDKATACLDAVAAVPDPQTALLLLRHCVSYTKLTYSMRVTPPAMHAQALQAFDDRVRACLEQLGGLPLTIAAWEQACLGVALGGLGLRSAAHHAPAAFLASASATATHCQGLDPQYVLAWPVLTDATSRYNLAVPAHDQFSQPCTQQHLSVWTRLGFPRCWMPRVSLLEPTSASFNRLARGLGSMPGRARR